MTANEVKQIREALGLTQVQLAQLMGLHPITVSKWERGESEPTPYQVNLLNHFREGARTKEVKENLVQVLLGMGVAVALALLLKHLLSKK